MPGKSLQNCTFGESLQNWGALTELGFLLLFFPPFFFPLLRPRPRARSEALLAPRPEAPSPAGQRLPRPRPPGRDRAGGLGGGAPAVGGCRASARAPGRSAAISSPVIHGPWSAPQKSVGKSMAVSMAASVITTKK